MDLFCPPNNSPFSPFGPTRPFVTIDDFVGPESDDKVQSGERSRLCGCMYGDHKIGPDC